MCYYIILKMVLNNKNYDELSVIDINKVMKTNHEKKIT